MWAAPEAYIAVLNKFHQHNTTCAPSFVQTASVAALRDEKNEVNDMVKEYQRRRDYAVQGHQRHSRFELSVPQGRLLHLHQLQIPGKTLRRAGLLSAG